MKSDFLFKGFILLLITFLQASHTYAIEGQFYIRDDKGNYLENREDKQRIVVKIQSNSNGSAVFLKTEDETYLSANRNDLLIERRNNSLEWETFSPKYQKNGSIEFRTYHGTFLSLIQNNNNLQFFNLIQTKEISSLFIEPAYHCNQNNRYFIRSWDGKYLQDSLNYNRTGFIFSSPENKAQICLENKGSQIALKANDNYFSANRNDLNLELRENAQEWESFNPEINQDGSLRLKSYHNRYLIAVQKDVNTNLEQADNNKDYRGRFFFIKAPRIVPIQDKKCYYLKNNNQIYAATNQNNTNFYPSFKKTTEAIYCVDVLNGKISLRTSIDNKYITTAHDLSVGKVNNAADWEYFTPVQLTNGAMSLKTFHNTYLGIDRNGNFRQITGNLNENSALFFEETDTIVNSSMGEIKLNNFFDSLLSKNELTNFKNEFIGKKSLIHPNSSKNRFINFAENELNYSNTCPSPRIATYHSPNGGSEAYCFKIPTEFKNNIPNKIKKEIMNHDINSLDIFFIAQNKNETFDPPKIDVLRVHNWVYPKIPSNYEGSIFNRNLLMTMYSNNSNIPLTNQIIEGELKVFDVNIHDNLISPDNAHTAIATASPINFSFYSLVIDPKTKRAVVTLHWLIEQDDFINNEERNPHNYKNSIQYLNKNFNNNSLSIKDLISRLEQIQSFNPNSETTTSLKKLLGI